MTIPNKKKKLKGTLKKCRTPKNEMLPPEVQEIETPGALINDYATTEWLKVTGILSNLKMLHQTDTSILLAYCNEMGKYFQFVEYLKTHEFTFTTPNGFVQSRPEVKMANDSLAFAIKLSDKFGFNPAARNKIEMPDQKPTDKFEEFE